MRHLKNHATTRKRGRLKILGSCLVFLGQSCQGLAGLHNSSKMSHKFSNQHHQLLICLEPPNGEVVEVLNCLSYSCWVRQTKNSHLELFIPFLTWSTTVGTKKDQGTSLPFTMNCPFPFTMRTMAPQQKTHVFLFMLHSPTPTETSLFS